MHPVLAFLICLSSFAFSVLLGLYASNRFRKLERQLEEARPFFNELLQKDNLRAARAFHEKAAGRKRILYVIEGFGAVGGTETRLESEMKWLGEHGWACALCLMYVKYPPLWTKDLTRFTLSFREESFTERLAEIVRAGKFDTVEFVFLSWEHIRRMALEGLKKEARVGALFTTPSRMPQALSQGFDYRIIVNDKSHGAIADSVMVPNWLRNPVMRLWRFEGQKKALFISRHCADKLSTLRNFLDICEKYGVEPVVAGPAAERDKRVLAQLKRAAPENILGTIETVRYLEEHAKEYLFVGGVGMVVLEAASLGVPALICPHIRSASEARFVTDANFPYFASWNFVIKTRPPKDAQGRVESFFDALKTGGVQSFLVSEDRFGDLLIDNAMRRTQSVLLGVQEKNGGGKN